MATEGWGFRTSLDIIARSLKLEFCFGLPSSIDEVAAMLVHWNRCLQNLSTSSTFLGVSEGSVRVSELYQLICCLNEVVRSVVRYFLSLRSFGSTAVGEDVYSCSNLLLYVQCMFQTSATVEQLKEEDSINIINGVF